MNADLLSFWWVVHDDMSNAISRAGWPNTANYRGYMCSWTIDGDSPLLSKFQSHAIPAPEATQARLPVVAGWVCGDFGLLRHEPLPLGRIGMAATPGIFIRLSVESGRVEVRQRVSVMVRDLDGSFVLGRAPDSGRAPDCRESRPEAEFHWISI